MGQSEFDRKLQELPDHVSKAMDQFGVLGLILGIMASREILQRCDEPDVANLLNTDDLCKFLTKVASGDLIMQDQLVTGIPYDEDIELSFRRILDTFLELNQ